MKNWGFEDWKALVQILCGFVLIFSFVDKHLFKYITLYYSLFAVNIIFIVLSTVIMLYCKERNKL
jgi:hypothetical protein